MNILLLSHYFAPENSAPQRRWSSLISRLVEAGHAVDVICPPPHYPQGRVSKGNRLIYKPGSVANDPSGARVFRTSFLPHDGRVHTRTLDHVWVALASCLRARKLMKDGVITPDIIVATAPAMESLIAGRWLARRYRLPLVAEMRDAWPDLVAHTPIVNGPRGGRIAVKRRVHEFITRLQRGADAVVTTTEAFASVLSGRGIDDVTVLRNATETSRYSVVPTALRAADAGLRALYIGTVGRSQGLDRVVVAAARLKSDGILVQVRIVGYGADVARLRRLNRRLGQPVEILGAVDRHDVLGHYVWADTTIVSLRAWAPFAWTVPSKLYELLAVGKHITAIVEGEAANIIRAAGAGHVVAPGDTDALEALWRSLSGNRSQLWIGGAGRNWVGTNADFSRLADDYMDVLERACQRHARMTRSA